jgi:hypothetical protein
VSTVTGPAAPGTVGPTGLTGPKGDPGGIVLGTSLGTNDLNAIITAGTYYQSDAASGTLARNYPKDVVAGNLVVYQAASANLLKQVFYPINGAFQGKIFYVRQYNTNAWTSWAAYGGARFDQSAGRTLYQWDDLNNREQMTYGDTGWRDLTILVGTAAWLRVRRIGNTVWLWGAAINLSSVTPSEIMYVLPAGFRTGSNSINALIGRDGTAFCIFEVNLNGNLKAPFTGSTPRTTDYYFMISFPTTESWPTSLPGTASGFIPNL